MLLENPYHLYNMNCHNKNKIPLVAVYTNIVVFTLPYLATIILMILIKKLFFSTVDYLDFFIFSLTLFFVLIIIVKVKKLHKKIKKNLLEYPEADYQAKILLNRDLKLLKGIKQYEFIMNLLFKSEGFFILKNSLLNEAGKGFSFYNKPSLNDINIKIK